MSSFSELGVEGTMRGRRGSWSSAISGLSKVRFCPFSTFKLNIHYTLLYSLDFRIISALSVDSFKKLRTPTSSNDAHEGLRKPAVMRKGSFFFFSLGI